MIATRMASLLMLAAYATLSWCAMVHMELDLTWETGAPDGQARKMVMMNGQSPGPQLSLNQGDHVVVSAYCRPYTDLY